MNGSCVHMVMRNAKKQQIDEVVQRPCVLRLSAQARDLLEQLIDSCCTALGSLPQQDLADFAFTMNTGRPKCKYTAAVTGSTCEEMIPTSGKVIVDGQEISSFNDKKLSQYRAEVIGFIFQFYNLIPGLTAYENVALVKDIKKSALDANEMLDRVGLSDQKHKFPAQMSGGQQQRVSIARALAKDPKIILGDEPTGALDSETGRIVIELLQKLSTEDGNTVILVTHNADIAKCANKVIHMKNAKIKSVKINEHPLSADEIEW